MKKRRHSGGTFVLQKTNLRKFAISGYFRQNVFWRLKIVTIKQVAILDIQICKDYSVLFNI
ncbi:MAG: hypothetical protein ACMUHX_03290 [bacterium]